MKKIIGLIIILCLTLSYLPVFADNAGIEWPAFNPVNDMPFFPSEGYASEQNPPNFSWQYIDDAESYEIVVASDRTLKNILYEKKGIEKNVYNFEYTFEEGKVYYWSVRFKTASGYSKWAEARRFLIEKNAYPFPMINMEEIENILAKKGHPYYDLDLTKVADSAVMKKLQAEVDVYFGKEIPEMYKDLSSVVSSATPPCYYPWINMGRRIANTAFIYKITGNKKYLNEVKRVLNGISHWDPAESFIFNQYTDTIELPFSYMIAISYDVIYNELTELEREKTANLILNCIKRPFKSWGTKEGTNLYRTPNNSHALGLKTGMMSALIIYNENNTAKEYVENMFPFYVARSTYRGVEDGTSATGAFYGLNSTDINEFAMLRDMGIINILNQAFHRNADYNMIYMWPPNWYNNIGDAYNSTSSGDTALLQIQAYAFESENEIMKGVNKWHLEKSNSGKTDNIFRNSDPQGLIRNNLDDINSMPPVMLPNAKFFKDSGYVTMYSNISDNNKVGMIFHSKDIGSYNHAHPDQNSFVIQAYGQNLAIDSDYYDSYHSNFDLGYNKKTYSHNAITHSGGVGQPHNDIRAKGKIIEFVNGSHMVMTTGDAKSAYKGFDKMNRTILYIRPEMFIVVDDIKTSNNNVTSFEWWLNALGEINIYEDGTGAQITQNDVQLDAKIQYPQKVDPNYINYFAGPDLQKVNPPAGKEKATDKRVYFETEKTDATRIVTTLDVHKTKDGQKYFKSEEKNGVLKLSLEDGTVVYVKLNDEAVIEWDGYKSDANLLAVKGEDFVLSFASYLSYDGKTLFECDKKASLQLSSGELAVSSVLEDANIRVYAPYVNTLNYIKDEKHYLINSNDDFVTFKFVKNDDGYVNLNIYNGQYYFYINDKKLPGSEEKGTLTLKIDDNTKTVEVDGYITSLDSFYADYKSEELDGVYILKSCENVSIKTPIAGSAQIFNKGEYITLTDKKAYLEFEKVKTSAYDIEINEDNNIYKSKADVLRKAYEYDNSNVIPTIKFWESINDSTLQGINAKGSNVSWDLEVKEEGYYDIVMSYSTVSAASPERMFKIGDENGIFTCEATDVYSNLNSMRIKCKVYLMPGIHSLEMMSIKGGEWIVEWIGLMKSEK